MNIFDILLTQPLTNGLILFYRLFGGNMGIAILTFSVFLIIILRPLTKPYMDSMKKIKELEPQLAKLRKKYAGDKLKFSQAQAEIYRQKKVNPGAGCIPYLLQIVILIALFKVFTTALGANGDGAVKLNSLLYEPLRFSQGEIIQTKFLYLDVAKPDVVRISGFPFPIPGVVLILATLAQFLSVKVTSPHVSTEQKIAKKTKGELDDMQVAMQSSMTYTFPLLTLVFGMSFPSGLALYWLVFSLVNFWQQVKSSGWGGMTPFIRRLGLIEYQKLNSKN